MLKIKINFPTSFWIKLYKIKKNTFLIIGFLKLKLFFELPGNILFIKKKSGLFFFSKTFSVYSIFNLRALYLKINSFFLSRRELFCKKLLLKGLGFRVVQIHQSFVELKLGFSHFVKVLIPLNGGLSLYINKSMLIIKGPFKSTVGNFACKIKSFRLPDCYKGKGIWYKKEIKLLKEVKKT